MISFALSMYLENWQLKFLEAHPITVNLISGVVGFSTGILVVGVGFNWMIDRERLAKLSMALGSEWNTLSKAARQKAKCGAQHLRHAGISVHELYLGDLDPSASRDKLGMQFTQALEISRRGDPPSRHDLESCLAEFRKETLKLLPETRALLERHRPAGEQAAPLKAEEIVTQLGQVLSAIPEEKPEELIDASHYAWVVESLAELHHAVAETLYDSAKGQLTLLRSDQADKSAL
ncbi:hypothetical protein [Micromonospora globbae]|uniref:hypothetical protein n=1 Tax=Micromonospora globbae TaxID=1894969 RepID=UPI00379B7E34